MKPNLLSSLFKLEASGGILLMAAAILAILVANSPLGVYYQVVFAALFEVKIAGAGISKPILLWINDGLMAIFFLLVGLELKRELVEGELSDKKNIILPGIGAIGGMFVPALFYYYFNHSDPELMRGWAIPAATDIAFALGVLTLLGSRVPLSLKVFLVSLAILDDIGAILIIAIFYTSKISTLALMVVALCAVGLAFFNFKNVSEKSPYILLGGIMWVAMLKSGVHATLAGVLLAFFIPLRAKGQPDVSPLKSLEHDLHPVVAFFVLPVFAFANAGINLSGVGVEQLTHSVPIGIALGLFFGKQIGIFGLSWLAVKAKLTSLPPGVRWVHLYGASALCGIGFTMSLFIGSLAFGSAGATMVFDERLGIIIGSLASGILGYCVLNATLPRKGDFKRQARGSEATATAV